MSYRATVPRTRRLNPAVVLALVAAWVVVSFAGVLAYGVITDPVLEKAVAAIIPPVVAKPPLYRPKPADFQLAIIVLSRKCFGSAGCNVTYRLDVAYLGDRVPDSDHPFRVLYTVSGGDDPQQGSFRMVGSQVTVPAQELAQTPSAKAELVAVVTGVIDD